MRSKLKDIVINNDVGGLEEYLSILKGRENWSLITFVDELLPYLVMESNLRYGNFHMVKMSLF